MNLWKDWEPMNKLIMSITSDSLDYLNMIDAESAVHFEREDKCQSYASAITRIDDMATMGTPPDGQTPQDVAQEKASNIIFMEPTTLHPVRFRINHEPVYLEDNAKVRGRDYNQLLRLLTEMRESLWRLETTL